MGKKLEGSCKCGYTIGLNEGRGKLSPTEYIPSYCMDCENAFSMVDNKKECPNCGSNNIFPFKVLTLPKPDKKRSPFNRLLKGILHRKQVDVDFGSLLENTPIYLCPRCKNHSLSFYTTILWD